MSVEPRVATFFVRCPDPLGFPERSSQLVVLPFSLSGFPSVALHIDRDGTPFIHPATPENLFVSARFHVGKRSRSIIYEGLHEMNSVLSVALPEDVTLQLTQEDIGDEASDQWASFSVAELTTPVVKFDQ